MTELWVASFVGAALFFAAGLLAARRREKGLAVRMTLERTVAERRFEAGSAELHTTRADLAATQAELAAALEARRAAAADLGAASSARQRAEAHLAAARADAAHRMDDVHRLSSELAAARTEAEREREQAVQAMRRQQAEAARVLEAARKERAVELATAGQRAEALRGEAERSAASAKAQATELGALHAAASALSAERDDLADRLAALGAERDDLVKRVGSLAGERNDLGVRIEALRGAQAELARTQADRRALLEEVGDLRARLRPEPEPADVAQLRHELVIAAEVARARADEAGRVRDENVRLRERVSQLEDLAVRFDAVVAENDELRSQRFLAEPPQATATEPPPTPNSLQELVQRVSEVRSVRAAVITDELGLVVAATGDYSDVLAAYGRHLADEGQRVGELLPLRTIRELIMHDDHNVTMTVRPLPVGDAKLALVTLGVGAEPEGDVCALLTPSSLQGR